METGERLAVPERVIVSPASGRFRPSTEAESEDVPLDTQTVIGYVDGVGHTTEVRSPFRGFLKGLMAHAGERVREGQPVAWLTIS